MPQGMEQGHIHVEDNAFRTRGKCIGIGSRQGEGMAVQFLGYVTHILADWDVSYSYHLGDSTVRVRIPAHPTPVMSLTPDLGVVDQNSEASLCAAPVP